MKFKHIWTVFKKELTDIIRDRKTLMTSILAPLILMPILLLFVGGSSEQMAREMTENITVALTTESNTPEARAFLEEKLAKQNPDIIIVDAVSDPWQAIQDKKAKLVVELDKDFEAKLASAQPIKMRVLYDRSLTRSSGAVSTLQETVNALNQAIAVERVTALGLDPQILTPVITEPENIARSGDGNLFMMMTLPMLIAMLVSIGGIPAATDLVAGEKERMTLEPLLTTRAGKMSILMGKYLTINVFSFASVLSTLAGMLLAFIIKPSSFSLGQGQLGGFALDPVALVLSLIITLLLGMTFSGVQLALSTYARSFKEGQTYLSLLTFVVMIPAYATMAVMSNEVQLYMFLIPILNTISAFKMILGGVVNYTGLFAAIASSVVYVFLTLALASWMFNKEKYMFRS